MKFNGKLATEDDFSILNKDVDVWYGELPWKRGDKFPTDDIKERANISKTNRLLYENELDTIYNNFLQVIPEIDPIYGYQLRELIARLPYNKTSVEYYAAMICGYTPFVNGSDRVDTILNTVLENSNASSTILAETRSRFLDTHSVYRVYKHKGVAKLQSIPAKNCVAFVDEENTSEISVIVIFNIYKTDKGSDVCEFTEYHEDGVIKKRVFNYSNGTLGREIVELACEGKAFDNVDVSPLIWCRHNTINDSEIYGRDQFRYWDSSLVMAMRELQNLFRAGEKARELMRKVPNSAISKDPVTGRSMFLNRGTIGYDEAATESQNGPDIKYIQPDFGMVQAAINAFDAAMDTVSNSTGLGKVFFGIEKAGSNLSAKSIEAMLYPTRLLVTLVRNELSVFIKDLANKLSIVSGLGEINKADISINWRNSFPYDEKEHTDSIVSRYEKKLISKTDAIVILDDVPLRIAKQRAAELDGISLDGQLELTDSVDEFVEAMAEKNKPDVNTSTEFRESGASELSASDTYNNGDDIDNANAPLWEHQMPFA